MKPEDFCVARYLDSFHRSKGNIGEELSRSGGGEVKRCSVEESVLFAHGVSVEVLEDFVETELAGSLHGVTDEGGSPSSSEGFNTSLSNGDLKVILLEN